MLSSAQMLGAIHEGHCLWFRCVSAKEAWLLVFSEPLGIWQGFVLVSQQEEGLGCFEAGWGSTAGGVTNSDAGRGAGAGGDVMCGGDGSATLYIASK